MPTPHYPMPTNREPGDGGITADLNQAYRNINDLDDRVDTAVGTRDAIEAAAAEATAAAELATDISNITVDDDVVEVLIKGSSGAGPKTRAALASTVVGTTNTRQSLLGAVAAKVAAGQAFRIMSIGTSKQAVPAAVGAKVTAFLATRYGAPPRTYATLAQDGGTNDAVLGWNKQPYGGPKFFRIVGTSSSSTRTFTMSGDTIRLTFGREADSVPVAIDIDGVSVGNAGPTAGSQLYGLVSTFETTRGDHTVTIHPPASGSCYLEAYEAIDSTDRVGVELVDATLGGSNMNNMFSLASGGQTAGIAIVGDNGINAHFNRSDIDAWFLGMLVNDVPGSLSQYKTQVDKAVAITAAQAKPLVILIEAAGHWIIPTGTAAADNAAYLAKRDYLLSLRKFNHVTVLDLHAATSWGDSQAAVTLYRDKYFPDGIFTYSSGANNGFIHENADCYDAQNAAAWRDLGLGPAPTQRDADELTFARWRTPNPATIGKHALVGAAHHYVNGSAGGAVAPVSAGGSTMRWWVCERDPGATNLWGFAQTEIYAAGTSDAYGPYIDWDGRGFDYYYLTVGEECILTVRISGEHVGINASDTSKGAFYAAGRPIRPRTSSTSPNDAILNRPFIGAPTTIAIPFRRRTSDLDSYMSITGRVYEIAMVKTTVPVLL